MTNKMAINIQFFIGCREDGEVKASLNKSGSWKEEKIIQTRKLVEAQFEGREYIGVSIESLLSSEQLKQKLEEIKLELHKYCPKLNIDKQVFYLFPQVLIC